MQVPDRTKEMYIQKPARELRETLLQQIGFFDGKFVKNLDHSIECQFGTQSNTEAHVGGIFGGTLGRLLGSKARSSDDLPRRMTISIQQVNDSFTVLYFELFAIVAGQNESAASRKFAECLNDTMEQMTEVVGRYQLPELPLEVQLHLYNLTGKKDRGELTADEFNRQRIKTLGDWAGKLNITPTSNHN